MMPQDLKKAAKAIRKSRTITIACHINPDGDCIGSLLALGLGLRNLGKRVFMISKDGVPERYAGLPAASRIKRRIDKTCDLAITVDCNGRDMLGSSFSAVQNSKRILEIDHHAYRKAFGDISIVDTKAAAVGELIYLLLKELKIDITDDIAQSILTSIIVETNSFRLPTIRPLTFDICSKLLADGIDFPRLSEIVYWSKTKAGAVLSGACMAKTKFLEKGKIAWSIIRKRDFVKMGARDEDVDSVASDMLAIRDVKIAVFFRENHDKILRVSLRSKNGIDVGSIAVRYGGGGHFDAAGCTIFNKKSSIEKILNEAKALIKTPLFS